MRFRHQTTLRMMPAIFLMVQPVAHCAKSPADQATRGLAVLAKVEGLEGFGLLRGLSFGLTPQQTRNLIPAVHVSPYRGLGLPTQTGDTLILRFADGPLLTEEDLHEALEGRSGSGPLNQVIYLWSSDSTISTDSGFWSQARKLSSRIGTPSICYATSGTLQPLRVVQWNRGSFRVELVHSDSETVRSMVTAPVRLPARMRLVVQPVPVDSGQDKWVTKVRIPCEQQIR